MWSKNDEQVAKADCECPIFITYTNVNGYLIPNLTYKSGEQMEQLGKYGFLRRDGIDSVRSAIKELEYHGYVERHRF